MEKLEYKLEKKQSDPINLLPEETRKIIEEIAKEQVLVELERNPKLMSDRKRFDEEFRKQYEIKKLTLAQKWLEGQGKNSKNNSFLKN